jgi:cytidyltransferase-like protein
MAIVYYPGSWDLFHYGHFNAIQKAKSLVGVNGRLYIGVESDLLYLSSKHGSSILNEKERFLTLSNYFPNDIITIYNDRNYLTHLKSFYIRGCDIFCCGPEFGEREDQKITIKQCEEKGIVIARIPRTKEISTSEILKRIIKNNSKGVTC